MHFWAVARLIALLALANGVPVIVKRVLGPRFAFPLDGNATFVDGRPWFGTSKTIRGVMSSIVITAAGAPLVGVAPEIGALIGAMAMAGDLVSSFVKRRLGRPASSRALGLDQVPESLFPALACRSALALTWLDIVVTVTIFFVGELVASRLLYKAHLRDEPY